MKKIISVLLVICCVVLCTACGGRNRRQSQQSYAQNKPIYVYVCTGKYATKYHSYSNCKGLNNCKGTVVKMTKQDAEQKGKSPCSLCY